MSKTDHSRNPRGTEIPVNIDGLYEKRRKVYARSVRGLFNNWRWILVFLTQALYYGLCWLDWGGRQAVLFHLVERKFYIFGAVFWPQDAIYLAILLVIAAYTLFLVTAVGGRLFCGYACPQTVYTEIFMWIERKIEGERPARMKLDAQPMSARKFWLKSAKHALWAVVAIWTGFTFVGYFTPIRDLAQDFLSLSPEAWSAFWVGFYALATYGNAGFLREQMCRQICPYARFQFVMFDPDTLIIAYDTERGESRGARAKGVDPHSQGLGDCVDCGICVQVCPTGIDIRNGLQNECIGCAACIDACDTVMDKLDYPRGLIRYSTENAVSKRYTPMDIVRRAFRPRVMIYSGILFVLSGVTAWSLATRVPLKVNVLKDHGTLSREADDGGIENTYQMKILNTGDQTRTFHISITGIEGIRLGTNDEITVTGGGIGSQTVVVIADPDSANSGSSPILFTVEDVSDPAVAVTEKSKFWMP